MFVRMMSSVDYYNFEKKNITLLHKSLTVVLNGECKRMGDKELVKSIYIQWIHYGMAMDRRIIG